MAVPATQVPPHNGSAYNLNCPSSRGCNQDPGAHSNSCGYDLNLQEQWWHTQPCDTNSSKASATSETQAATRAPAMPMAKAVLGGKC